MIRNPRRVGKWLAAAGAVIALAFLVACAYPQGFLSTDSGSVQADVLVVLGGGWTDRSEQAARLFKEGAAPQILVSGDGDCHTNHDLLLQAGVPEQAIHMECDSRNTRENAELAVKFLRQHNARRVILVTTWYHSRRALACFRHYAPDIQFFSRPSYYAYPRSEWARKDMPRHIRSEYVKLMGYWLCYGVRPF